MSSTSKGRTIVVNVTKKDIVTSDQGESESCMIVKAMTRNRYQDLRVTDEGTIEGATRRGVKFSGQAPKNIVKKIQAFDVTKASSLKRWKPFSFKLTLFRVPAFA